MTFTKKSVFIGGIAATGGELLSNYLCGQPSLSAYADCFSKGPDCVVLFPFYLLPPLCYYGKVPSYNSSQDPTTADICAFVVGPVGAALAMLAGAAIFPDNSVSVTE